MPSSIASRDVSAERADDDYELLLARLQKDEPRAKSVPAWDVSYLKERVRAEQLDFDAQSVRPYFEFSRVQAGLLAITSQMFGVQYRKVDDAKTWHPDVDVYDVFDGGKRLGRIYLDLHPRAGKFSHAAQFTLVTGKEGARLPEGVLLCNFPKGAAGQPALMEQGDVSTFFHEFGHLLHHVFAGHTRWTSTAGLRESDFVEAPSQLLEEWVEDAPTLQTFAKHYQTGEPIPAALVARMKTADEFARGLDVRRQMFYAAVSASPTTTPTRRASTRPRCSPRWRPSTRRSRTSTGRSRRRRSATSSATRRTTTRICGRW